MSVHHSGKKSGVSSSFLPEKMNQKSGVSSSFWKKSGVSSSFLPEKMNRHRITWGEIRCQGGKSGVSSSFWGKSSVGSSFWKKSGEEIRCQFTILARGEIRCRFIILEEIRCQFTILARKKSGVSSPFLPEKMNRHRISREKMNRHRISPLWREKGMSLILTV